MWNCIEEHLVQPLDWSALSSIAVSSMHHWLVMEVLLAIRVVLPFPRHRIVDLMCNNSTVSLYIFKVGSIRLFKLRQLTIHLFQFCYHHVTVIHILPVHLLEARNIRMDALPCLGLVLSTKWSSTGASLLCVGQTRNRHVCHFLQ